MSYPFNKLTFTGSKPMTSAVLGVSLAAVGTAIYLSPSQNQNRSTAPPGSSTAQASPSQSSRGATSSATPTIKPSKSPSAPGRKPGNTQFRVIRPPATTDVVIVKQPSTKVVNSEQGTTGATKTCTDFTWQQDAQAAYAANLSDPWGLDGKPGPHNDDGLACTQLPRDPARAASTPVDPYTPPTPADKAALVSPTKDYFGLAEDGLPGDTPLYDTVTKQAGKAPSSVEWFSYWDSGYDATKVQQAWGRGALPVITWMSTPSDSSAPDASNYSLANIVSGKFDAYLRQYAGAVLKTGLPVAIRFDHEMNGNWYPWSAGLPANQSTDPSKPNLYVQAWQHIWNVFDGIGANAEVIWLWTPVRVDNIKPNSTVSGSKYETSLQQDYPGDNYVDWVGTSAYQYKPSDGWTYETTFRKTFDGLTALSGKPIFVAETGATQSVNGTDYSAEKAQWTQQTLAGLAAEPNVVGFTWFNNNVDGLHKVDGQQIQTNWQFDSSPQSLAAFRAGIADSRYSSGTMPDGTGG